MSNIPEVGFNPLEHGYAPVEEEAAPTTQTDTVDIPQVDFNPAEHGYKEVAEEASTPTLGMSPIPSEPAKDLPVAEDKPDVSAGASTKGILSEVGQIFKDKVFNPSVRTAAQVPGGLDKKADKTRALVGGVADLPVGVAEYLSRGSDNTVAKSINKGAAEFTKGTEEAQARAGLEGTASRVTGNIISLSPVMKGFTVAGEKIMASSPEIITQGVNRIATYLNANKAANVVTAGTALATSGAVLGKVQPVGEVDQAKQEQISDKSAKIGAVLNPAIPAVAAGVKAVAPAVKNVAEHAGALVSQGMRDKVGERQAVERFTKNIADKDEALANLTQSNSKYKNSEFTPTTAQASKDTGIYGQQLRAGSKDAETNMLITNRNIENKQVALKEFRKLDSKADPEKLKQFTEATIDKQRQVIQGKIADLEEALAGNKTSREMLQQKLISKGVPKEEASSNLDSIIRDEIDRLDQLKDSIYNEPAIKNKLVDINPLAGEVKDVLSNPSTLKDVGDNQHVKRLLANLDEGTEEVSLGELNQIHTNLNRSIKDAIQQGKGEVADGLKEVKARLRNFIDDRTDEVISSAEAKGVTIKNPNDFFKGEYAPALLNRNLDEAGNQSLSSVGKFRNDLRKDNSTVVNPDKTADRFVKDQRSLDDLVNTLNKSTVEGRASEGLTNVQDYLRSDLERTVAKYGPDKVKPEAIQDWLSKNEDALNHPTMSEFKQEITSYADDLINNTKATNEVTTNLKGVGKDLAKLEASTKTDTVGSILKNDPVTTIQRNFNPESMKKLLTKASEDTTGDSTKAVKQGMFDYLSEKVIKSGKVEGEDSVISNLDKYLSPGSRNRQVIEQVHGKEGMKTLDEVHGMLKDMSFAPRANAGQSITAEASMGGNLVQSLFERTPGLGMVTKFISKNLDTITAKERETFYRKALLDPEYAEAILKIRDYPKDKSTLDYVTNLFKGGVGTAATIGLATQGNKSNSNNKVTSSDTNSKLAQDIKSYQDSIKKKEQIRLNNIRKKEESINLDKEVNDMKAPVQKALAEMIKQDEGYRVKAYDDSLGYRTVGIGFNMDNPAAKNIWKAAGIPEDFDQVKARKKALSKESIIKLMNNQLESSYEEIKTVIPGFDKLSDAQQTAFMNMHFQLGHNTFSKFKKMLSAINKGNFEVAKLEALNSDWAKQTPNRAKKVTSLFT